MDKRQRQEIEHRARGLIKDAVGKIAVDKKAAIRTHGSSHPKPRPGPDDCYDAGDRAEIDIYGAHPSDD